jgi:exosortase F-associated protein
MEITGRRSQRVICGALAFTGLGAIYLFQYTDLLHLLTGSRFQPEYHFISNRMVRILLNDMCMLVLIYALFKDPKIVKLAFYIQGIDLLILLPLYLLIKLQTEGVSELSSPFLAQFHRLIVNPTLMILLVPALFYQKMISKR